MGLNRPLGGEGGENEPSRNSNISPLKGFCRLSLLFLCSNKSCSTLRICLTTTRSASPLLSVWLKTFWNSLTAAVIFYWAIWESIASWSLMGPCPDTQTAPQGSTEKTAGHQCLHRACTCSFSVSVLLWYTQNQHYRFIHLCSYASEDIFLPVCISLVLQLKTMTRWIICVHLPPIISCCGVKNADCSHQTHRDWSLYFVTPHSSASKQLILVTPWNVFGNHGLYYYVKIDVTRMYWCWAFVCFI